MNNPGDPSDHMAHVEVDGRPVASLTMVTSERAGISSARAKDLVQHAAKAIGWAIERENDDRGTTLRVPESERSERGD